MEQIKQETIDKWLIYLNVMGCKTTEEELRQGVGVAWGWDGGWYVQTTCDEEHLGQSCGCIPFAENSTEEFVQEFAKVVAEDLELPLYKW